MIGDLFFNKKVVLVVGTGGPCSGKSKFKAVLRKYLENRDCMVATLSEFATEMIDSGLPPWAQWRNPIMFQESLFGGILFRESIFVDALTNMHTNKKLVLYCDRGALDARAYMSTADYNSVLKRFGYNIPTLMKRYNFVIHLVTAADGAEQHYTLENNKARTETPDEARQLDKKTLAAWEGHPHLVVIDNSSGFEQKMTRALNSLTRVLGMPDPMEKERKFVVLNFSPLLIPTSAVRVEIEQDYLVSNKPSVERRIRKRTLDGISTYYYTEKFPTEEKGVRVENEQIVTPEHAKMLLSEKDPSRKTICKDRYCFEENGHHFELDVYRDRELVVLEVEVVDMSDSVRLPRGFECTEVTGEEEYSNNQLALL